MNNLQYHEQELQSQFRELELEKTRLIVPTLYDYLKDNKYVFETTTRAYKPLDDNFEIGVSIYKDLIEIWLYDRKKSGVNSLGQIVRYEINPSKCFSNDEENLAISFLETPPVPQEYEITFEHKEVCYWIGDEKELADNMLCSINSGWQPDLHISFIKKL